MNTENANCGIKHFVKSGLVYMQELDFNDSWVQAYIVCSLVFICISCTANTRLGQILTAVVTLLVIMTCDQYKIWWARMMGEREIVVDASRMMEMFLLKPSLAICILIVVARMVFSVLAEMRVMRKRVAVAEELRKIRQE